MIAKLNKIKNAMLKQKLFLNETPGTNNVVAKNKSQVICDHKKLTSKIVRMLLDNLNYNETQLIKLIFYNCH